MDFLNAPSSANKSHTLDTANQIYFDAKYAIKDTYQQLVRHYYGGNFESLDFAKAAEVADRVNGFVREKTRDKIHDLIDASAISGDVK